MPKAPASARATDHANFSFGLVNIPVSVYGGTVSDHGIKRNQFVSVPVLDEAGVQKVEKIQKDDGTFEEVPVFEDHPVGSTPYDKVTDKRVQRDQIVKKIATEYGHVYVEDHEVEQLFEITPKTIVVKEFQPQHLFHQGHYVPKSLYFVEASKMQSGKKKVENAAAQTALAMVFKAMREENALAVVEFTTRGTPKPAVMLPDGTLWVVYHTDELREQRPLPEIEIDEALVAQGRMLLKAFWGTEPLDLTDKRTELIQAFADEKAQAGDFSRSVEAEEPQVKQTDSSDLMAMLAASVEQAKSERKTG